MIPDPEEHALALLAILIERRTGIHHAPRDRPLLLSKLRGHADTQGHESLLDYYRSIEYDDADGARFSALVDALVVGETYLMRERAGIEQLVERVRRRAEAGARTRIWCAACATGEEVVSLAALLASRGVLDRARIVASDLSERHVARARAGRYGRRALRALPRGLPPWIEVVDEVPVISPGLLDGVEWRTVNLVEPREVEALGRFDAILCRNVLIYFDDPTVVRVTATLAGALVPGGTLLVGASESLLRFATHLECVEEAGVFSYRLPREPG